jgi:hypothetical protein
MFRDSYRLKTIAREMSAEKIINHFFSKTIKTPGTAAALCLLANSG